jgi:putative transposase
MPLPMAPNERWSLDFVSDVFTDGRKFRILTVVDDCTRECLTLLADTSLSGIRVARALDRLISERCNPRERYASSSGDPTKQKMAARFCSSQHAPTAHPEMLDDHRNAFV